MSNRFYVLPLSTGLRDAGGEDGLELPSWYRFQNWRPAADGSISRRKGCARRSRVTHNNTAFDFDGSTNYLTINLDTRVHTLKRVWTFEALCKPDGFAAQRPIWDVDHAADYSLRVYFTTAGKVEAKVQDSAGTVVTLTSATTYSAGTKCAIQVVRSGTTVTLRVNGATEDTDTVADLDGKAPGGNMYVGEDDSGNEFDGVMDFVRCLSVALPDQRLGYCRFPYPLDGAVLWDYEMEAEVSARCNDRSRFGNHAVIAGTMSTGTALCEVSMPVFGMTSWTDRDTKARAFFAAGNAFALQELAR